MEQKFFEIFPQKMHINFMGNAKLMLSLSAVLVLGSLGLLVTRGLNYGVDFVGGTQVTIRFHDKPEATKIRSVLSHIGLKDAVVQAIGDSSSGEFLIRVPTEHMDITQHKPTLQSALDRVAPTPHEKAQLRFGEDRVYAKYSGAADIEKIKAELAALNEKSLQIDSVVSFGKEENHEYLILFSGAAGNIVAAFEKEFGKRKFEILQTDQVGPKVGEELRTQAIGAVLISMLLILIYVWFRFEYEFAIGAVLALFHDPILVLGVFSLFRLDFDLSIVAAILTVIGFSINDTIVIFDRIRENLQRTREPDLAKVMNDSLNQTLSRTILTSGTVLMASLALVFFGGPITFNFSIAFTIGVVVGTYSSLGVASPLTLFIRNYRIRRRNPA